jgi:hypothetical protein
MPPENKCEELKIIRIKLDELIKIKNRGGLLPKYARYIDNRISLRSGQLLRGNL